MTNALLSGNKDTGGNPAIDHGLVRNYYNFDQRLDPFKRVVGDYPDIGSYEVQTDDIIFNDSFRDGCPY